MWITHFKARGLKGVYQCIATLINLKDQTLLKH
jgi:hypothetical protein